MKSILNYLIIYTFLDHFLSRPSLVVLRDVVEVPGWFSISFIGEYALFGRGPRPAVKISPSALVLHKCVLLAPSAMSSTSEYTKTVNAAVWPSRICSFCELCSGRFDFFSFGCKSGLIMDLFVSVISGEEIMQFFFRVVSTAVSLGVN